MYTMKSGVTRNVLANPEEKAMHGQEKNQDGSKWLPWENTRAAGHCRYPAVPLIAFILLLPFVTAPAAATDPTVIITGYEVTPAVLMPGDLGTIAITITNTAQAASEKESAGIVSGGTFASTKSTDINAFIENVHLEENGIVVLTDDFDRIGELGPGQSVPITFVIRAPAVNGIYFPEAWVDVKDGRSTRYPVMVNVNTDLSTQKKPALSVTQQLPDGIAPGESCSVEITVENTGLTRASDISMVAETATESLVLTTSGRHYRDFLDPSGLTNLTLHVTTDKNTPVGIGLVTMSITYRNPDGTAAQQLETIGIPVRGRADMAVSSVTTDPVRPAPGSTFTLIIRVENTGSDQATSVKVTLDSPLDGTKTTFIGSIDKDSDAPAIFHLQSGEGGSVPVNLTISYDDDFGSHAISESSTVTVGGASALPLILIAVLILCAGAGAAYWYVRIRPGKAHAE